jgi:hypothetical protein
MRKTLTSTAYAALLGIGLAGCIQPIPNQSDTANGGKSAKKAIPGLQASAYPVYTFYDEDFQQGGFTFVYGGATKMNAVEGDGADSSEYFLHANLDQKDYSGVAVCLWNMDFDVTPYTKTGALVFQVRGKLGDEGRDRSRAGEQSVEVEPEGAVIAGFQQEMSARATNEGEERVERRIAHRDHASSVARHQASRWAG